MSRSSGPLFPWRGVTGVTGVTAPPLVTEVTAVTAFSGNRGSAYRRAALIVSLGTPPGGLFIFALNQLSSVLKKCRAFVNYLTSGRRNYRQAQCDVEGIQMLAW